MKKHIILFFIVFFVWGCSKENFNPEHPDVETFVQQIKNGTYDIHEKLENGEKLWLVMPDFNVDDIPQLLSLSMDTTRIKNFPSNPASSHALYPGERDYLILGECLLWVVEAIRKDLKFASLHPYLINADLNNPESHAGLSGAEVQLVSSLYRDWWDEYKNQNWQEMNPLENSNYAW